MAKEFNMEIEEGFDFILEEGANTSTNLRRISWGGRDSKIDIRKWSYQDGAERAMKGVTLSDEGTDELANVLVEQNFGDTKRIIKAVQSRDDYNEAINHLDDPEEDDNDDSFYDPADLLNSVCVNE